MDAAVDRHQGAAPTAELTGAQPGGRLRLAAISAILASALAATAAWNEAPAGFSGQVVDVAGRPVVGAQVTLASSSDVDARGRTDEAGRWTLTGGHRIDGHRLAFASPGFLPVDRTARAEMPPVVLHRLPDLRGRVVDDTGAPVAGAEVIVQQAGRPAEWNLQSGGDGAFALPATLLPGAFAVTVSAPDHDPFLTTVGLAPDARVGLEAVLVRQLGTVTLKTDPAGMEVTIDGRKLDGCATPCSTQLLVGRHTIGAASDLYVPWSATFELDNRQQLALSAHLERKTGVLRVTVPGPGELTVDGQAVSGGSGATLPTGIHGISYRSDGFWPLDTAAEVTWQSTTTLDLTASLTAIHPGDEAGFLAGLAAYLGHAGGQYGIWFRDLTTGHDFGYHADDVMEAASDIKIPVALYLLHQAQVGAVKLDDKVTLQVSDFMAGTGILDGTANSGDQFSYSALLTLLIEQSDNTAWQALDRALGADTVDAYAASLGAPDCHQVDDNCTAHEAGLMVADLYRGRTLDPGGTATLLNLLENTVFNDRINYYLPGTPVAHKTGADGGVMNDVGVVYANGRPFIISMFTVTDSGTVQPIRDVARAAAHYFGK